MRKRIYICLLMALAICVSASHADTFIKQSTYTAPYEMMGDKHPEEVDTSTVWLSASKACMNISSDQSFIVDMDKNLIYMVDHAGKAYAEMSTDAEQNMKELMGDQAAQMPPQMMEQMMSMIKVTVTPTEETKKIGKWDTKKYVMESTLPMGKGTNTLWMTEVPAEDLELYHKVTNVMMMSMPGFSKMLTELEKIKGLPVLSEIQFDVMGAVIKSKTELLDYSKKDAPAGTYDLPKDYTKKKASELMK